MRHDRGTAYIESDMIFQNSCEVDMTDKHSALRIVRCYDARHYHRL
jgi:hypothetical protein